MVRKHILACLLLLGKLLAWRFPGRQKVQAVVKEALSLSPPDPEAAHA